MICFYAFSRPNRKQHDCLRGLSIIQNIKKTPVFFFSYITHSYERYGVKMSQ